MKRSLLIIADLVLGVIVLAVVTNLIADLIVLPPWLIILVCLFAFAALIAVNLALLRQPDESAPLPAAAESAMLTDDPAPRRTATRQSPGAQQDLNAIRDFLLDAFNAGDFEDLLAFAESEELRKARNEYVESDSLPAKVRKMLDYCQHRSLIPDLLAEVERRREQRYPELRAKLRGAAAVVLALPADLADFTGREDDLAQVRAQLEQEGAVAISGILGMGGIGKTALAVHLAHQLIAEGRYRYAQLYLDLKGTDPLPVDPAAALESLLNAVAGTDPGRPKDVEALSALWRQAIHGLDALLILDNAAGAAQVRPLLPGCATCAVLVTSRQRFKLAGAGMLDLRRMGREEARKLLRTLAPRLDEGQADAIAKLCGDLPLALRVAGNYLGLNNDVKVDTYKEMLAEQTRLARLRDPDNPDLDVAAAIALSVAQLDERLTRAWALLALFPAPFDPPAAAALWGELQEAAPFDASALDDGFPEELRQLLEGMVSRPTVKALDEDETRERLQALRNRSLASYDAEPERYYQHDLVRLAAAKEQEAAEEGQAEAARLRLARHYEGVARAADALYLRGGENVLRALALFDREWPHIQAGQAWAAAHAEEDSEAARLCSEYPDAGAYCLDLRLHPREQITWLEAAARAARRLGDQETESYHLGNLGNRLYRLGEIKKAIVQYNAVLEIAQDMGDQYSEGNALGNLGNAYADLGEMEKAIEHHTAALEISKEIGDRKAEGQDLGNLGIAYKNLGEMEKAIDHYGQALVIARQIGDRRSEGSQLGNLGNAYADMRKTQKAIDHYQQARQIQQEIGDRHGEGTSLGNLGNAYADLGKTDKAIEYYQQALAIAREIGGRRGEENQLGNLGNAYLSLGKMEKAIDHYGQALAIARQIGDRRGEANHSWNLGLLYVETNPARAIELMTVCVAFEQEIGHPDAEADARRVEELRKRL